jgi:hypothetical protein
MISLAFSEELSNLECHKRFLDWLKVSKGQRIERIPTKDQIEKKVEKKIQTIKIDLEGQKALILIKMDVITTGFP